MQIDRLDKILSGSGKFSRAEARAAVQSGLAALDGIVVRDPGAKVSRSAVITVRGERIDAEKFVYFMLHKPAGYISGAAPEGELSPVTDLLPDDLRGRGLFCAGRLDADVTGLLLLTNDGALAHWLTAPRSETPKTYRVKTDAPLTAEDVEAFAAGITLRSGTAYRPAALSVDPEDPASATVTVTEGKYHEVKNLFAARGRQVLALERISIGGLFLDETLAPGEGRRLSAEEMKTLF